MVNNNFLSVCPILLWQQVDDPMGKGDHHQQSNEAQSIRVPGTLPSSGPGKVFHATDSENKPLISSELPANESEVI